MNGFKVLAWHYKKIVQLTVVFFVAVHLNFSTSAWAEEIVFLSLVSAKDLPLIEKNKYTKTKKIKSRAKLIAELKEAIKSYPENHPAIAHKLNNLGLDYKKTGEFDKSLPLLLNATKIYKKTLGDEHNNTLISMSNLAFNYFSLREYKKALILQQYILGKYRKKFDSYNLKIIGALKNLIATHKKMGRLNKVLELYQRIVIMKELKFGKEDYRIASSLNNLALSYASIGDTKQALALYKRILAVYKKKWGKNNAKSIIVLNNLGSVYTQIGNYDLALSVYKQALKIAEMTIGETHINTATNLNSLAVLYNILGQYDAALPLYQRAFKIFEKKLGLDDEQTITTLNNLAVLQNNIGNYEQSLKLHLQALVIYEKKYGNNDINTAIGLNNLAGIYYSLGKFEQALTLFNRALKIVENQLGKEHIKTASTLNNIALLYKSLGKKNKSLPLYKRALAINLKQLGENHVSTANSLSNLAVFYDDMGDYKKALPLIKRALAIYNKKTGNTHPTAILSLTRLAYIYNHIGSYDIALKTFNNALILAQNNPYTDEVLWVIEYGLFSVYNRIGKRNIAILWGKEAVNTIQSLRLKIKKQNLKSDFFKNKKRIYSNLADLLISKNRISEAQIVLQMLKEEELVDILKRSSKQSISQKRIILTGLEKKRFTRYFELRDQQLTLAGEKVSLQSQEKLDNLTLEQKNRLSVIVKKDLPLIRDAMLLFLKELQEQSDQYTQDKAYRQNEAGIELVETNLQKAMLNVKRNDDSSKVVALQYVVTDKRLSILLSTAGSPPLARQVEIDGEALRHKILNLRELLYTPESKRDFVNLSLHDLYKTLIVPIEADLKKLKADTLILVLNDVLRYVPFSALYDGSRYLIQDYTLALFNEAVKKDFGSPLAENWRLAAMGLTRAVEQFPALTNVRDELQAVTKKSGLNGTMYLDDEFTRQVFTSSLTKNFNVLHVASHFEFVAGRADVSRLFLGDRSSLYLADIVRENMRFDKFSLVTFSACETGLGGGLDADGREMESLGALVQNQGASAVLATLWKVEDSSTASLMEVFYRLHKQNNLSKAQALRMAQLKFVKRGKGVLGHPYYWAPFILMGDWR